MEIKVQFFKTFGLIVFQPMEKFVVLETPISNFSNPSLPNQTLAKVLFIACML
jgi:hypothetical protein